MTFWATVYTVRRYGRSSECNYLLPLSISKIPVSCLSYVRRQRRKIISRSRHRSIFNANLELFAWAAMQPATVCFSIRCLAYLWPGLLGQKKSQKA